MYSAETWGVLLHRMRRTGPKGELYPQSRKRDQVVRIQKTAYEKTSPALDRVSRGTVDSFRLAGK